MNCFVIIGYIVLVLIISILVACYKDLLERHERVVKNLAQEKKLRKAKQAEVRQVRANKQQQREAIREEVLKIL